MVRPTKKPAASANINGMARPFRESGPQSYRLGARSCLGCHQRKVRCDRAVPCANCSRFGMTCVYPTRDMNVGRKTPSLQDISNRLARLEILLSRLLESSEVATGSATGGSSPGESQIQIQAQLSANVHAAGTDSQHPPNEAPSKSTWELLLNDERVVRYANHSNVEPLLQDGERSKTTQPTGSAIAPSHLQTSTTAHQRLPAQPDASTPLDEASEPLDLYPDTDLALRLWNVYVKSVDPVLKILHIPTVQSTVLATVLDPRSAQSSTVALTFAIYYAAVTALCHDDSNEPIDLPWEKPVLLKRYKTALDRILMMPELMNRPEIAGLQALAIYVTCLRAHELGRRVWVLNGLAIRLAQSIGLHRDGASLKLGPFETEMRLRLWWHLCVLDSRALEDQGFQPTVDLMNRELRLPLNVNDNQIYPDMTRFPAVSDGWTEMSFFLIQTEACRLMHPILETQEQHSADSFLDIQEKRKMVRDPVQYMSDRFGISHESGTPTDLPRIATQHVITACKKMEFVLQLREEICMRKQKDSQDDVTPDVCKLSFKLACDGLKSSHVLLKEGLASRFKWFFNMYTQWYALAYVLRCLCSSPSGFETDRAWALVEGLFPSGMSLGGHTAEIHDYYGHGNIWRFLNLLRHQALSFKQHAKLSASSADVGVQPSSSGKHRASQFLPDTEIQPSTGTAAVHGTSALPELGQELIVNSNQNIFSSLDLLMPEISFLPDWNAIINGQ